MTRLPFFNIIFRNGQITNSFRSTLLWVGLLTVLLSCEWGLILLYYAQGSTGDSTVAIFLAAIAIFHAIASFIYHCLCNIKVRISIYDFSLIYSSLISTIYC